MKGIQHRYNFIANAAYAGGTFAGETMQDCLKRQANTLMDKCPWLDRKTVENWVRTHGGVLISDPARVDEVIAAVEELKEIEHKVIDLPKKVEESYMAWAANGKPGQRGVMNSEGVIEE